jgi:hypothetical protein
MPHDYKRNGTTCLFAALNVLDGTIIGSCQPRYRNGEFLKFFRKINRERPKVDTLQSNVLLVRASAGIRVGNCQSTPLKIKLVRGLIHSLSAEST